jgi:L-ascorbate metabolism protein UlaG (beta-lactamase superfamily)
MDIRFLGHACFELVEGDTRVLIDPFLTGNPKAAAGPDEVEPTHLFLTHGHPDHYGDVEDIAKRTSPEVVAIAEIANELGDAGVENLYDPNLGGTVKFDWAARPSTTSATPRCSRTSSSWRAGATPSTSRWSRSGATTPWTASTP